MRPAVRRRFRRPKGVSAVLAGLLLPVVIGVAAFGVDTGVLGVARAQLSTAADSAALAGAQQLADDYRLQGITNLSTEISNANTQAQAFGQANLVLGTAPVVNKDPSNDGSGDILVGYLDPTNPNSTLDTSAASSNKYNSVQVTLKRTADHVGTVPSFFSQVLGFHGTAVSMQSTATAWPYAVKGFKGTGSSNLNLLPILLDVTTYNAMMAGQTQDNYTWNPSNSTVTDGPDGITESLLYPVGSGSPGNWGTIKIGISSNTTSTLGSQVQYGITPSQLSTYPNSTIQLDYTQTPPQITFSGNPGISAGLKPFVDAVIGKAVWIPIYDLNWASGSNTMYRVIEFAAVRIMADNFSATPKYLIIQPALIKQDGTAIAGSAQPNWTSGGLVLLHLSR